MSQVTLDDPDMMITKQAGASGQIYLGKDAEGRRCKVWVEFVDETETETERVDEVDEVDEEATPADD